MGWMGSLVNGLAGNLNEISPQETEKEFGAFLMEGETVQACFRLVRDVLIVTDKRIIDIDKQGATGTKLRVSSIDLSSVFRVTVETAGFGVDDSEITVEYDKLIDRQLERAAITSISGFAKIFQDATKVLKLGG